MSSVPETFTLDELQLGFRDKLASYVAWALAGALFFTVGWIAFKPIDPLGPVSLATGRGAVGMLAQASLLAIVAASSATVIVGRKLPDAGTFAAALGLGVVSIRGGTMEFLLLKVADEPGGSNRALAAGLALEAVGWGVVVAVALVTSAFVSRWFHQWGDDAPRTDDNEPYGTLAGWDVPLLGALMGRPPRDAGTSPATGTRHVAISTVTILAAYQVFATGLGDRVITHGQVCFLVAASVCAGGYIAYRFAPVRSALWSVLAVLLSAVAAYLIATITSGSGGSSSPANIPASRFLRALPVQIVAVGSATAVATFWWRRTVGYMMQTMLGYAAKRSVPSAPSDR